MQQLIKQIEYRRNLYNNAQLNKVFAGLFDLLKLEMHTVFDYSSIKFAIRPCPKIKFFSDPRQESELHAKS